MIKVSGKRRCDKGKACGATCISRRKVCVIETRDELSESLNLLGKAVSQPRESPGSEGSATPTALAKINGALERVKPGSGAADFDGDTRAKDINWRAGLEKGAKVDGEGQFGAFVVVPPERLAKGIANKYPGGVGVKYGEVSKSEIDNLRRVGNLGLGPRMIAAKINENDESPTGVLAMSRVPGTRLKDLVNPDQSKVIDSYFQALAGLHKAGVSHNDPHDGNALLHNGKVGFVDFGMAKSSYQSALSEAIFRSSTAYLFGKFQSNTPIQKRILENVQNRVIPILQREGFTRYKTADSIDLAAKKGKIPEELCKELVRELYHGIL